jgi:RHS repeat-associated protein
MSKIRFNKDTNHLRNALLAVAASLVLTAPVLAQFSREGMQAQATEGASSPTTPPQQCTAQPGGATCSSGDQPASQPSASVNVGAGNPINVITGNKYQRETDMAALPGVLGLEVVRHYNSAFSGIDSKTGILGRGWKLSYETQLEQLNTFMIAIVQADGTRHEFERTPKQPVNQFRSPSGLVTVSTIGGATEYVWRWSNGRSLSFNQSGRLTQIAAPTGEFVTLQYDPRGWLIKVTDPQNRSLEITYLDKAIAQARREQGAPVFSGVQAIQTPLGQYRYQYGSVKTAAMSVKAIELVANLVKVIYPSATASSSVSPNDKVIIRVYHYESPQWPTLLTGITIQGAGTDGVAMNERLVTWTYDEQGRANLSVKGYPARLAVDPTTKQVLIPKRLAAGTGIEQVTLTWPSAGTTVLTNSLGQETIYKSRKVNGQYQLTQVVGAGCATCGEVNMRYGYDAQARLTEQTQLDTKQAPIQTSKIDYDAQGRVSRVSQIGYVNAKAQAAQLQARYEYANTNASSNQPSVIATPSVVAGKERIVKLSYNDKGQITERTEQGFSPLTGNNDVAKASTEATPITRNTTYGYTIVNNKSVLTKIDGPLPNGLKGDYTDSDVMTLEWDSSASFVRTRLSLGTRSVFEYGAAGTHAFGRVTSITSKDNFRQVTTELQYNGSSYAGSRLTKIKKTASLLVDGRIDEKSQLKRTVLDASFDIIGRLTKLSSTNGVPQSVKAMSSTVNEPVIVSEPNEPQDYSLVGSFGESGTVASNEIVQFAANGKTAKRLFDDFGRVVAVSSPQQNWQFAGYDLADRIIVTRDARGAKQIIAYNLQGRVVLLERHSNNALEEIVQIEWAGDFKQAESVQSPQKQLKHQIRYTHNALGLITKQESQIYLSGADPVLLAISTQYNDDGQPISKVLPSGKRLAYRYYTNDLYRGQLAAIEQINWPATFDWFMVPIGRRVPESWLPKTTLASLRPSESDDSVAQEKDQNDSKIVNETQLRPQSTEGLSTASLGDSFDASGYPASLPLETGSYDLKWNAAGQLSEVRNAQQFVSRYGYDSQGRRATKTTARDSEFFVYEGTQLIAVASTKQIESEYVYAGYKAIAWLKPANTYLLSTDERGGVVSVKDSEKGLPVWTNLMNAWGLASSEIDAKLDPKLRLVNQYFDTETGLHYNVARYYDPRNGRFISPDPMGISDSIDRSTPESLKLDVTAYAAGQPYEFFDPDGAAKIRYYAMTNDKDGRTLGSVPQGYAKARWAFFIFDIQPGGDPTKDLGRLRNQYAQNNSGLLFDGGGNFFGSASDPLSGVMNTTKTSVKWDGSATGSNIKTAFDQHYSAAKIGTSQFDVDFSDDNATKLIAFLMADTTSRASCVSNAPSWLPNIVFGNGDVDIKPTAKAVADSVATANLPRILNCGRSGASSFPVTYANNTERDRVERITAAAEGMEIGKIGKDCSLTGCYGVDIRGSSNRVYRASYGRLQFVGETFLRTVNTLSAQEKITVGLTADIQRRIGLALSRSNSVGAGRRTANPGWFYKVRARTNCAGAAAYFDNAGQPGAMSTVDQAAFLSETNLDRVAFIDMACFVIAGPARTEGEGRNAFMTEAIFSDATLKTWMMDLFKGTDKFDFIGRTFIRDNLRDVLANQTLAAQFVNANPPFLASGQSNPSFLTEQRRIERNLAMRVARLHNSGAASNWNSPNVSALLASDPGGYVSEFLGSRGTWPSLRCAEPTDPSSKWIGLEMSPLILN